MVRPVIVTLQTAAQVLRVPPFRIIHLCEEGCITPFENAAGRGSVRRFDRDNLLELAVCLELQNAGIPAPRILHCVKVFQWLRRMKAVKHLITERGLFGVIESLGTRETPAMLHVKVPERGTLPTEPMLVFIQIERPLPSPPESGFGFTADPSLVNAWPVRVSLNLTYILSTICLY
jgi:hypothetical protein